LAMVDMDMSFDFPVEIDTREIEAILLQKLSQYNWRCVLPVCPV